MAIEDPEDQMKLKHIYTRSVFAYRCFTFKIASNCFGPGSKIRKYYKTSNTEKKTKNNLNIFNSQKTLRIGKISQSSYRTPSYTTKLLKCV